MQPDNTKRVSRLTAILTHLQSKRLVTARSLATKFGVSMRTIYRDIKALEQSGVPILTEEGQGYSIMEGYRVPPVMFTEREAFALLTTEHIILRHKDASLVKEYSEAVAKIKAVLRSYSKEKVELLEKRMYIGKNFEDEQTSRCLIDVQFAITNYQPIQVRYEAADSQVTERIIEPFSLYHTPAEDWMLAAYCRLRQDFRSFRLDRMKHLTFLPERFAPHELTMIQFAAQYIR